MKKSGLEVLKLEAIVLHSRFPDTEALLKSQLRLRKKAINLNK